VCPLGGADIQAECSAGVNKKGGRSRPHCKTAAYTQAALDQLRESIIVDLGRLREMGVLDLPRLPQGVVANSNADLPMNGGSNDQAE